MRGHQPPVLGQALGKKVVAEEGNEFGGRDLLGLCKEGGAEGREEG